MLDTEDFKFLVNLANSLDSKGFSKSADLVDQILAKSAGGEDRPVAKIKVHPLEYAVSTGLLNAGVLEALIGRDDEEEEIEELLDLLRKDEPKKLESDS